MRGYRSSQKWTQRVVQVLQRLLAPSLSHNVGLLFGENSDHHKTLEIEQSRRITTRVPPHQKKMLWTELKDMFTFPEESMKNL